LRFDWKRVHLLQSVEEDVVQKPVLPFGLLVVGGLHPHYVGWLSGIYR